MAYQDNGTLTDDGTTDEVQVSGYVTCSAHYDSGTGTMTWQFKGPDGVWRSIYAGSNGTTEQAFSSSHISTLHFGGDVRVRGNLSSSSSPQIDWQIISSSLNRV